MISMAYIIDIAINEHLWNGSSRLDDLCLKKETSCDAIVMAGDKYFICESDVPDLFSSLGCSTLTSSQFDEFPAGPKRQYARALWLTWAAMIAREEGL